MHLELLGDSIIEQVVNQVLPTAWQDIVAANIGLPVTSSTLDTYGTVVQNMMNAYNNDYDKIQQNGLDPYSITDNVVAADIANATGQPLSIAHAFLLQVQHHDQTGSWSIGAITPQGTPVTDPNAVNLPSPSDALKSLQNIAIAGAVIVGGYFALQLIGFIPKPHH